MNSGASLCDAASAASLRGKRILITGGAGFVGSQIAELLLREEDVAQVVVLDNMARGRAENLAALGATDRLRLVIGDVRQSNLLDELVRDADIVFHQAALRITQCAAEPRHGFEVMATAVFNLLELCATHRVEKIVAASSASIYGLAPEFPTTEAAAPYADRTLYGGFKLFNESLLRAFCDMHGLRYCALRYFNVFGPRMDIHGRYTEVLIRWMERVQQGLPPLIFGDGSQTMDFIDVRDVARANIAAARAPCSDEVVNIASGQEVSLTQLARALCEIMGRPDLVAQHLPERSVNPVSRRLADTAKARRLLGFETRIGLHDGLRDLVAWWQGERASGCDVAAQ